MKKLKNSDKEAVLVLDLYEGTISYDAFLRVVEGLKQESRTRIVGMLQNIVIRDIDTDSLIQSIEKIQ